MNEIEMYATLRDLIGNPKIDAVPNRQLLIYMTSGLERLAERLEYEVVDDSASVTFLAGTYTYSVPQTMLQLIHVEWNGGKLLPSSIYEWDRTGKDWRNVSANFPTEYAVQGRELIFYPKPSAAAVTADSAPTLRYIKATPGMTTSGPTGLGDGDHRLACLEAAIEYCVAKINEDGMAARAQALSVRAAERWRDAMNRAHRPIKTHSPEIRVRTNRRGAAR